MAWVHYAPVSRTTCPICAPVLYCLGTALCDGLPVTRLPERIDRYIKHLFAPTGGLALPRPESPDGYPTLLLALLGAGPAHGYDLVQRMALRSGGELRMPAGLVYPLLHGLEQDGLVAADWAPGESGRRRRAYTLTERGRRALADRTERWERHRVAVDRILQGHSDAKGLAADV